ncbi:argonaute-like protein [Mycena galericulata]|nr:argonaute-like protein [Mycena galericulata]
MPPRRGRGQGGGGGSRGGGRGRGGEPQPAHPTPAPHLTTVAVRRPGYGSSGIPIPINVNSFVATIPDGFIFHYDGVISGAKNIARGMSMDLIKELQDHVDPMIFGNTRVSFDGQKNLYSPVKLDLGGDSREFDVSLPAVQPNPNRPPKIYKIRLTLVAKINTEILHRFNQGQQSQDSAVDTALHALNTVIRMAPSQNFPVKGPLFYTDEGSKVIGYGLVLWRGYFQSIRPAVGRMLINVDIATGVMYQAGSLIRLCLSFLEMEGNSPLRLAGLQDRDRRRLSEFIEGVRFTAQAAGSGITRAWVIRRLSRHGANEVTFAMRGGRSTTVSDYFQETSGRPLMFPSLLCVEVGEQGALIPLELCTVLPGQLVKKELPDDKDLKSRIVEFSTAKPDKRLAGIRKGFEVLAYGQSDYVRRFGLAIEPRPGETEPRLFSTQARLLKPPTLKYGSGTKAPSVNPKYGSWNMADKHFYRPATISVWVLIIFDRFNDRNISEISKSFVAGCRSTGIIVNDPNPTIRRLNGQGNITQDLLAAGSACKQDKKMDPSFAYGARTVHISHVDYDSHSWGDVTKGVPTQCLKPRNCVGAKINFWANVAAKINVKLGGINVIIDPTQVPFLADPHNPTVIMGADVMHPPSGSTNRPSYAAVVSSVDPNAAKYITTQSVQKSRQELITDLKRMTINLMQEYMSYREHAEKVPRSSRAPKRLIFYRDGVSEGQFKQVLDEELQAIKAACKELNFDPKITLLVVGKRHHIRLFPVNVKDADRSGNCPAGTVVDRDIVHPTEFDFYLQSHGGILGTSRSGHYSVLHDENNLTADAVQALSFALCHVYAGATRSVSIPAPVYYADRVCERAKLHFDPTVRYEDSSESADSDATSATKTLEVFKRDYKATHANQARRMYFA